jgi:hypothetical protein
MVCFIGISSIIPTKVLKQIVDIALALLSANMANFPALEQGLLSCG